MVRRPPAGAPDPLELVDEPLECLLPRGRPGVIGVIEKDRTDDGRDDISRSLLGVCVPRVPRECRLASLLCRVRLVTLVAIGVIVMPAGVPELSDDRLEPMLLDLRDDTDGRFRRMTGEGALTEFLLIEPTV